MSASQHQPETANTQMGSATPQTPGSFQEAPGEKLEAKVVPDSLRIGFPAALFGNVALGFHGENMVGHALRAACAQYSGGPWDYFVIVGTKAGFLAPCCDGLMHLQVAASRFDEGLSPRAAGIVATLQGMAELLHRVPNHELRKALLANVQTLRDYADQTDEASAIYRATH